MSYSIADAKNRKDCELFRNRDETLYVDVTVTPGTLPFPSDYVYHPCLMYKKYQQWAPRYQGFEVKTDDVWIVGFPKSGTTWMSNIVYALLNGVTKGHIKLRNEYFEAPLVYTKTANNLEHHNMIDDRDKILDEIAALPSPRIIKSHSPAYLLPKDIWNVKPKIIYIEREVKDAAVSAYNTSQHMTGMEYNGPAGPIYELIYKDFIPFGPYYYHGHSYKQLKGKDGMKNIFFTSYEDLKQNTRDIVKSIGVHLGVNNLTDELLDKIVDHVSHENMRNEYNNEKSFLCNDGISGSHRDQNVMSQDDIDNFDAWTKNKMEEIKNCQAPTI